MEETFETPAERSLRGWSYKGAQEAGLELKSYSWDTFLQARGLLGWISRSGQTRQLRGVLGVISHHWQMDAGTCFLHSVRTGRPREPIHRQMAPSTSHRAGSMVRSFC